VPRLENSILDFNRANFISGVYTDIMNEKDDGTCQLTELANVANASLPQGASAFSLAEIEEILKKQQKENRLMYDETNRIRQRTPTKLEKEPEVSGAIHLL